MSDVLFWSIALNCFLLLTRFTPPPKRIEPSKTITVSVLKLLEAKVN